MMKKILIINGPNLNLLGLREREIYGSRTYPDLVRSLREYAKKEGLKVKVKQTNGEREIICMLHDCLVKKYDGVVLNAGAYSHYSYAIRDAVASIGIPVAEVHLSNPELREDFRKKAVIAPVCVVSFRGEHFESYFKALSFLKNEEKRNEKKLEKDPEKV